MGTEVRPRGGGRELIGMALAAGYGQFEQGQQKLAAQERSEVRRLQAGAYQQGLGRQFTAQRDLFSARNRADAAEAAGLNRAAAVELARDRELADFGAANEEWTRRDQQDERQMLEGELRDLGERPLTPDQQQKFQSIVKAIQTARDSGRHDEGQMLDILRNEVTKLSGEMPMGEKPPEEYTDEWFKQQGTPSGNYDEVNKRLFFKMKDGREVDYYYEQGTNGPEVKFFDEPQPQLNEFEETAGQAAKWKRDQDMKRADVRRDRIAKRAGELQTEDAERRGAENDFGTAPPKPITNFIQQATDDVDALYGRPSNPLPDSLLPGMQPGEGGRQPGEPSEAELAVGRRPLLPAAEAANLPRISDPAEVANLPPGSQFIDPTGTVRVVPGLAEAPGAGGRRRQRRRRQDEPGGPIWQPGSEVEGEAFGDTISQMEMGLDEAIAEAIGGADQAETPRMGSRRRRQPARAAWPPGPAVEGEAFSDTVSRMGTELDSAVAEAMDDLNQKPLSEPLWRVSPEIENGIFTTSVLRTEKEDASFGRNFGHLKSMEPKKEKLEKAMEKALGGLNRASTAEEAAWYRDALIRLEAIKARSFPQG